MSEMGILRVTIGIESHTHRGEVREIPATMVDAIIHAGGAKTSNEVVLAEPGNMVLLGGHTIEGTNLRVDFKTKRLVPAGPVPVAALASFWGWGSVRVIVRRTPGTDYFPHRAL